MTRSCSDAPDADVFWRYRWSPKTTGPDRPPYGTCHARFSPVVDHVEGRFVSSETPVRAGPRQSGQSEPCRIATTGKASIRTSQSGMGFTMDGFIEVLIERVTAMIVTSLQFPVSS